MCDRDVVTREVRLCPLEQIPLGLGRAFEVSDRMIAVFRTRCGKVHAMENRCPHRGGPLADGMLAGDRVVCPFHAFRYDLASGACDQADTCRIDVFPIRIDGPWVVLTMPAP